MIHRRTLLLVAALALLATAAEGTTGVSSLSVDRGVTVAVADDSNAYLGVEQTATNTTNRTTNLSVTVTNRFPAGTTLAVDLRVGHQSTDLSLDAGVAERSTFSSVDCEEQIEVDAVGSGVAVKLTRAVRCS